MASDHGTETTEQPPGSGRLQPNWAVAVLDAMSDVVVVVDENGVVSYVSPSARRSLGHDPAAWVGRSGLDLVHPADVAIVAGRLRGIAAGAKSAASHLVLRLRRADGSYAAMEASGIGRVDATDVRGIVIALRDTHGRLETSRILDETRARLEFARTHDPLTQLPNRASLDRRLELISSDCRHHEVAAIVVRLAEFDRVRETCGTERTDAILRSLASELRARVPTPDIVAVLRAGEFAIVTQQPQADAVHSLAAAASRLVDRSTADGSTACDIRLAIGISIGEPGERPLSVLEQASVAARWSEAIGAAEPTTYDERLRAAADAERRVHAEVDRALRTGELELHYQPIVSTRSMALEAFEGLLRRRHADGSLSSAGEFIPRIEGSDLMLDLGDFVLQTGCARLAAWQARLGPAAPGLSLNVSARQLQDRDFASSVLDHVAGAGADPTGLCIELTETHAFEGAETAVLQLAELRRRGIRVALDDFGTGYSSLEALQRFGADILKIDRCFVERIGSDPGADSIVRASLDMGHAFGMRIVAEGVETEAQRSRLLALGCDRIQGWLIAPALEPEAADAMLSRPHEIVEYRRRTR